MPTHNFKDLTGKRFGRLIALSKIKKKNLKIRSYSWICKCDCGLEALVDTSHLSSGHTKSCGCAQLDGVRKKPGFSARKRVLKDYKIKAESRNLSWSLSEEQFDLLTLSSCYYCGAKPDNCSAPSKNGCFVYNGIDRVDNAKGYIFNNVVSCCKICNVAKHNMSQEDFLSWAQRVVEHTQTLKV